MFCNGLTLIQTVTETIGNSDKGILEAYTHTKRMYGICVACAQDDMFSGVECASDRKDSQMLLRKRENFDNTASLYLFISRVSVD